jgi:hypothetical protein
MAQVIHTEIRRSLVSILTIVDRWLPTFSRYGQETTNITSSRDKLVSHIKILNKRHGHLFNGSATASVAGVLIRSVVDLYTKFLNIASCLLYIENTLTLCAENFDDLRADCHLLEHIIQTSGHKHVLYEFKGNGKYFAHLANKIKALE